MGRLLGLALASALLLPGAAGSAPAERRAGTPSEGFFAARNDPRACPSPACGGFFVSRPNRATSVCPDGEPRAACYVAEIDLSRTGLPPAAREHARAALGDAGALVRGRLAAGGVEGFPALGRLLATEVWLRTGVPRGRFYRVTDTGIVCVTSPCFSLQATLLNRGDRTTLSSLRIARTGASATLLRRARAAMRTGSLLVAGTIEVVPDAGPAGAGRELVASALYLRAR